jgi:hypothetical protein
MPIPPQPQPPAPAPAPAPAPDDWRRHGSPGEGAQLLTDSYDTREAYNAAFQNWKDGKSPNFLRPTLHQSVGIQEQLDARGIPGGIANTDNFNSALHGMMNRDAYSNMPRDPGDTDFTRSARDQLYAQMNQMQDAPSVADMQTQGGLSSNLQQAIAQRAAGGDVASSMSGAQQAGAGISGQAGQARSGENAARLDATLGQARSNRAGDISQEGARMKTAQQFEELRDVNTRFAQSQISGLQRANMQAQMDRKQLANDMYSRLIGRQNAAIKSAVGVAGTAAAGAGG